LGCGGCAGELLGVPGRGSAPAGPHEWKQRMGTGEGAWPGAWAAARAAVDPEGSGAGRKMKRGRGRKRERERKGERGYKRENGGTYHRWQAWVPKM